MDNLAFLDLAFATFFGLAVYDFLKTIVSSMEKDRYKQEGKLNLCYEHQQENNYSHFARHNCDYCKLERKLKDIKDDSFN